MRATLTDAVSELTRPTYSSIRFGLLPAARIVVGSLTKLGTAAA